MTIETLSDVYTTREEIETIFGKRGVSSHIDDQDLGNVPYDDAEQETDDIWDGIVVDATDEINIYCLNWYASADMKNNKWVRRQASYLGCYYLSIRRGDPGQYAARREEILLSLQKIANGQMQIPRLATRGDLTPGSSNYTVDDRYRINKIRVQPSISQGGTYTNEDLDASITDEMGGGP